MAIDLELTRPKSVTTNALTATLSVGTAVETDTLQEESVYLPFRLPTLDPGTFTVASCTTTSGSAIVTTTNNGFASVKPGDPVTGTGVPGGTTVLSKQSPTQITLSANASASGTVTLTFDPPSVATPTVAGVKVTFRKNGSTTEYVVSFYTFDGSLGETAGTPLNATKAYELVSKDGTAMKTDFDALLTALRVFRSA